MRMDIIGAGIGGLTTAIAFQQRGIDYRIFEQSGEMKPLGAGIILANNAMQVFKRLGLTRKIIEAGNALQTMNITDHHLKVISATNLSKLEKKNGLASTTIHRGKLQKILLEQIQKDKLHLGKKLLKVVPNESKYTLNFEDQSTYDSEYILAADGIHSKVRSCLFSGFVERDAKQHCWRAVLPFDLPKQYGNQLNEAWGPGSRFGFTQIAKSTVYYYALLNNGLKNKNPDWISSFEDYHPIIKEMLRSTDPGSFHEAPITDIKPNADWVNENVCLMGDAAHATTPNLGQGACQAIEDALILAKTLDKSKTVHEGFLAFRDIRVSKAHMVVKASWSIGKVSQFENRLARKLRNFAMSLAPASLGEKQSEKLMTRQA